MKQRSCLDLRKYFSHSGRW